MDLMIDCYLLGFGILVLGFGCVVIWVLIRLWVCGVLGFGIL